MATNTNISTKRKFVADGLFYAKLNEFLQVRPRTDSGSGGRGGSGENAQTATTAMRRWCDCHLTVIMLLLYFIYLSFRTSSERMDMPEWRFA